MHIGLSPGNSKVSYTFDPYRTAILEKDFSAVPEEALKAYHKFKNWAWEQEQ